MSYVGSKRDLAQTITRLFPAQIADYREPCVGSGAVFFELSGRIGQALLADANPHVTNLYRYVRAAPVSLMGLVDEHWHRHDASTAAGETGPAHYYYRVRGQGLVPTLQGAARMLYLNKKGFNGLFRFNRKGLWNVPIGHGKRPVYDRANLMACSGAISRVATVITEDVALVLDLAPTGAFVYVDTPYWGQFSQYTAGGFSEDDHRRVAAACERAAQRGVNVVVSNSWCAETLALYGGWQVRRVLSRRSVSCRADGRGYEEELLAWKGAGIVPLPETDVRIGDAARDAEVPDGTGTGTTGRRPRGGGRLLRRSSPEGLYERVQADSEQGPDAAGPHSTSPA